MYYSGVSRISARGVLKVRPDTKSGGGGGGGVQFASGPIQKVGGNSLQVRYEKWGPLFGAQQIH